MTSQLPGRTPLYVEETQISLLAIGSTLLRWRRQIAALAILGGIVGGSLGLLSTRLWKASATVVPQGGSESSGSGLAAAASQFGLRVPSNSGPWGPQAYAELIRTRTILEPVSRDTVAVPELSGRRTTIAELLAGPEQNPERRTDAAVRALRAMVSTTDVRSLNGIEVTVLTPWPSVSVHLTNRVIRQLNEFNIQTRKSQAAAERQFVEHQAAEAEKALRGAEDRMQTFLQGNRAGLGGSPALSFEQNRLQREVALQQQNYASLLQSLQEAKMREVRDTPVITVVEAPRLPLLPESRGTVKKALIGFIMGTAIGIVLALLRRAMRSVRSARGEDAREFFTLLEESKPRLLRRGVR